MASTASSTRVVYSRVPRGTEAGTFTTASRDSIAAYVVDEGRHRMEYG